MNMNLRRPPEKLVHFITLEPGERVLLTTSGTSS